jgi:hypothetical protein
MESALQPGSPVSTMINDIIKNNGEKIPTSKLIEPKVKPRPDDYPNPNPIFDEVAEEIDQIVQNQRPDIVHGGLFTDQIEKLKLIQDEPLLTSMSDMVASSFGVTVSDDYYTYSMFVSKAKNGVLADYLPVNEHADDADNVADNNDADNNFNVADIIGELDVGKLMSRAKDMLKMIVPVMGEMNEVIWVNEQMSSFKDSDLNVDVRLHAKKKVEHNAEQDVRIIAVEEELRHQLNNADGPLNPEIFQHQMAQLSEIGETSASHDAGHAVSNVVIITTTDEYEYIFLCLKKNV